MKKNVKGIIGETHTVLLIADQHRVELGNYNHPHYWSLPGDCMLRINPWNTLPTSEFIKSFGVEELLRTLNSVVNKRKRLDG